MTQRVVIGLVALACTLTLAGCAGADASAAGHPSSSASDLAASEPAATAPTQPEPSGVTDADTCAAIGDVVTIVFNAELGVHEGRMSAQEQQGWYRLATRAFDRVQTSGSGELSEAVAELQAAIPPAAPCRSTRLT